MYYCSPTKRSGIGSLVEMWVHLDSVPQGEVSQKGNQISRINACVWNLEKWHRCPYFQGRRRDADGADGLLLVRFHAQESRSVSCHTSLSEHVHSF